MGRDYGVRVTKKRCPRENHSRFNRHEVTSVNTNLSSSLLQVVPDSISMWTWRACCYWLCLWSQAKQPRIGGRKLNFLAAIKGIQIGRDRSSCAGKSKTLLPAHNWQSSSVPNKVKDGLTPMKPEQLWVADITCRLKMARVMSAPLRMLIQGRSLVTL